MGGTAKGLRPTAQSSLTSWRGGSQGSENEAIRVTEQEMQEVTGEANAFALALETGMGLLWLVLSA